MKAWSYSSLTDFMGCPRRYHMVRDLKVVPFVETEAIRHGNEVHKALELRITEQKPLPEKYAQYEPIIQKFDRPGVVAEQEIALDKNFKQVGWWDKSCWVRGKIDLALTGKNGAMLVDWKTGKVKDDPSQLALFAAMKFTIDPDVEKAKTMFVFLKFGKTISATYHKGQQWEIWSEFIAKVRRLEQAYEKDQWLPKPSALCGWCPLSKEHCEFRGCK